MLNETATTEPSSTRAFGTQRAADSGRATPEPSAKTLRSAGMNDGRVTAEPVVSDGSPPLAGAEGRDQLR